MKKVVITGLLFMVGILIISYASMAGKVEAADDARAGNQIRQTNIKGYTLTYHLMDLSERGEMMKVMGHHSVIGMSKSPDVTNHLMVYIEKTPGKTLPAEVAFLIKGPDGKDFRTMTMGMHGGYGVDVNLKLKGAYTVRTKISLEGKEAVNLEDEFTFQEK